MKVIAYSEAFGHFAEMIEKAGPDSCSLTMIFKNLIRYL
jgi:hypothetical protein